MKERERRKGFYDKHSSDYRNTITYNESDEEDIENLDDGLHKTYRKASRDNSSSILLDIDDDDEEDDVANTGRSGIRRHRNEDGVSNAVYFSFEDNKKYSKNFKKVNINYFKE